MPGYFKPLRRMLGLLMLALACVFMGGWVRSLSYCEALLFPDLNGPIRQIVSYQGGLHWMEVETTQTGIVRSASFGWASQPATASTPSLMIKLGEWRWQIGGFGVRNYIDGTSRVTTSAVPYWSIVIPLTLLSTWLLLSKPRTKPADPGQSPATRALN